jgi:hypothetical protein
MSSYSMAEIARLERTRLSPGAVGEALYRWARFVKLPDSRIAEAWGCGQPSCCPAPTEDRESLEIALRSLPPRAAAELSRRITPIDRALRARSVPGRPTLKGVPWWEAVADALQDQHR